MLSIKVYLIEYSTILVLLYVVFYAFQRRLKDAGIFLSYLPCIAKQSNTAGL